MTSVLPPPAYYRRLAHTERLALTTQLWRRRGCVLQQAFDVVQHRSGCCGSRPAHAVEYQAGDVRSLWMS
jgi:hypothetical protein